VTSIFRHAMLVVAVIFPALAQAQVGAFENIDRLEQRVIGALGAGIGETGGPSAPIDRRLRLARCPSPAQINPPVMGALPLSCPEIGWRLRVPLVRVSTAMGMGGGMAVAFKAAPVIRKGDPVELFVETAGFSVSTEAIAQEDGAMGDRIRVKSDPKAPVMIAEIVEGGRVRLPGYK